MGRYIDENLAREGCCIPQCALDLLPAGDQALDSVGRGSGLSGMVPTGGPLILACWALAAIMARSHSQDGDRLVPPLDHRDHVAICAMVHKTGFINRQTFEMSLDKIESVDVDQSIPGRIFGYGNVTITGVGKSEEKLDTVTSPLAFRNAITAR
jgi:hypothetical protein